jgi:hypothetical protein
LLLTVPYDLEDSIFLFSFAQLGAKVI